MMLRNTDPGGYFLYHSIGLYPDKEADVTAAMAEFSAVWAAHIDKQWGFVLRKRQEYMEAWGRLIGTPKGSLTHVDNVADALHKLVRTLPEGWLRCKSVLVGADCFPSLHFLLAGLAPKIGFTLVTVPLSPGKAWVETEDFIAHWRSIFACSTKKGSGISTKGGAIAQRSGFALNHRQIMAPIINDTPWLAVRSVDDALMRANHMPLGHNHQPFGVQRASPARKKRTSRVVLR